MIAIVVATAGHNVIGRDNALPWYLPADLRHFKQLTSGHTVIMGRKTYQSIEARLHGPLPNRCNIVISSSLTEMVSGVEIVPSLEAALAAVSTESDVFIIGGSQVYQAALQQTSVQRIYKTEILADIPGDTFFPECDPNQWVETERQHHQKDAINNYDYDYVVLERTPHGTR